ncbi:MAG: hypothetical protein AAF513_10355 [Pseudomonadota bacterium]
MSNWHERFVQALADGTPFPSVQAQAPGTTLDEAYDIQLAFIRAQDRSISGYKAALTAAPAQQAMGIDQPVVGTLFADGDFSAQTSRVQLSRPSLLETELGFISNEAIAAPISAADIDRCFASVLPMIELASPNLEGPPSGIDLVATNAASYGYIAGTPMPLQGLDVDGQHVSLAQGETVLMEGNSGSVLGGQREALAWLANRILALGLPIAAGAMFMTGSIGGVAPAKAGRYQARFGALAPIDFTLG